MDYVEGNLINPTYIPSSTRSTIPHLLMPSDLVHLPELSDNGAEERDGGDSRYSDDPLVYANLEEIARRNEIEDIDRRPNPPLPGPKDEPIRVLPSGWNEYKTMGGR